MTVTQRWTMVMLALWVLGCSGKNPSPADTGGGSGSGSGTGSGTTGNGTSSGPGAGCFSVDPAVEVGTGEREFVTLEDGQGVTMVHGPQGGWHMLGSMQAAHMTEIVAAHFVITHLPTGVVVADNTYRVATVYDEDNCMGYYPGMYGYLYVEDLASGDLDTPPELMAYDEVQFCMTVTDQEEREEHDCRTVVALPDPIDLEPGDTGAGR
ncbi:MAG: hypothetical protein CL927_08885 [Deltaproteobacteria bacterium]|nr:hypothetical protein [Deltaproteobacteria bacterium]